jgi:hypothetical protein
MPHGRVHPGVLPEAGGSGVIAWQRAPAARDGWPRRRRALTFTVDRSCDDRDGRVTRIAWCVLILATLTVSGPARAAPVLLPTDFFLDQTRRAEEVFELTQHSERLFEMRYHLPPGQAIPREAGTIAVLGSTCVAAGLSISPGVLGLRDDDEAGAAGRRPQGACRDHSAPER